ncbi:MAG: TlpA family protein disulfide reductase [Desulfobacterota bacterium]|nr:TlpA family protein disulfide reductase [Thermodesulfobacteriota bacterium]
MKQRITVVWIAALIVCMLSGCSNAEERSATGVSQGKRAPDFVLKDIDGKQVSLSSFRNNNPVCLLFWATWCPYCVREIPRVKSLHEKYAPKGLKILSINIAANDPIQRVIGFRERYQLPYTILYDEQNTVSQLYGVMGIPVSVIIDRNGIIRYRGYQLPDNVEDILKALM